MLCVRVCVCVRACVRVCVRVSVEGCVCVCVGNGLSCFALSGFVGRYVWIRVRADGGCCTSLALYVD